MDLKIKKFSDINLDDSFFDSLKENYPNFEEWFARKAASGEEAYVFYENLKVKDFLYLKNETEILNDVDPPLPAKRRLKVGTFKLLSRGTRRGERFMKKIMDRAIADDVDEIYVTIFPSEELRYLISFFERFGFEHIADKPHGKESAEWVLVKNMRNIVGNIEKDYPFVIRGGSNNKLLSIYPTYHTKLFPDSILSNESYDLVQDITPTNSIYKIYITWMKDASLFKRGDNVVIYRTSDHKGPAYYRSVATSICTVLSIHRYIDYEDEEDFVNQMKYSVFNKLDLRKWYRYKNNFTVIKMLYNVAFTKKVIRKVLIEDVGIPDNAYWGIYELSNDQYTRILELGQANERYFID